MKITYLGTAAAEGFPAMFCNCEYCREGRSLAAKIYAHALRQLLTMICL